jgi:hypothetical protein
LGGGGGVEAPMIGLKSPCSGPRVIADRLTDMAKLTGAFLGAFAKLRKATIRFAMSGRIFMKIYICVFFEIVF